MDYMPGKRGGAREVPGEFQVVTAWLASMRESLRISPDRGNFHSTRWPLGIYSDIPAELYS
jgi:hypothetical protein